ncbi:hypothetical protein ACKWTF_013419 [Chironomus riparius]
MNCELCKSHEFKFTCPRCNIKYCSLDCYKSENHSQCSEAFYKECVVNELKNRKDDPEDKKRVMDMLQRIENEEDFEDIDSDDSFEGDLGDRLDGIDLNNADAVWDKLTKDEKEEFKSIVYNGEIENIVDPVDLWWKQKLDVKPVVDIEVNEKELNGIIEKCPNVLDNIKDFSKISTKKPAQCITYNIANIIGTYCYIYRFYNADHNSYELEATNNFISICDNLKANVNYDSLTLAVDSIVLNCHNSNLQADLNTKNALIEDVQDIFDGPTVNSNQYLLSAISDIINLFEHARHKYKQSKTRHKSNKNSKTFSLEFPANVESSQSYPELSNQTHFTGCVKKLEFYLSFLRHSYNSSEWKIDVV